MDGRRLMGGVLFSVPGRRGLGHVMRALNLAAELRVLRPGVACHLLAPDGAVPAGMADGTPVVAPEADDPGEALVLAARRLRPGVIVHDTALPSSVQGHAAAVYVMRRSRPERQAEVLASPALRRTAAILVPHTREEFGYDVPDDLLARCHFVGPIARCARPDGIAAARRRYGAEDAFLLTSTVGGGGFQEQAAAFLSVVAAAHERVAALVPRLRHVVVCGPHFAGRLPAVPGAVQTSFDPRLVDLLAASDLVVAEGGYNTVSEVRLAGVPAVFLPSPRSWDDQEQRVRTLEQRGLCRVVTGRSVRQAAGDIAAAAADREWLAGARAAAAGLPVGTGNGAAAQVLAGLLDAGGGARCAART